MKLSIIVPCYNEVDNVSRLQDELLPIIEEIVTCGRNNIADEICSAEMVFVDDGSDDGTLSKLETCFGTGSTSGVTYKFLKHRINSGLGAAIRTGFKHADGDIVVTVDSDGTYEFSEIPGLLACLMPGVDIVTASPYHPMGGVIGVPAYRLLLSRGSSALYRMLVDWKVHTYTCLFRAYRSEALKDIVFGSDDFLAGTEILVKAMLKGYRVAEFPTVLHKRIYGASKAKIAKTILSHLRFQGWVLLHRAELTLGLRTKQTP